ncbi:MAG: phosphotyrosine protein phosphatase [Burkholderiales bacterium]
MLRVLFVCSQNKLQVFADHPGVESTSAGTNHDAENPVTAELVGWAEVIVVMERQHRAKISKRFGKELRGRRVVCLDIPDNYHFMQPELIELLKMRTRRFLPATRALR